MSPIVKLALQLIDQTQAKEADAPLLDTLWHGGTAVATLLSSRHRHAEQVLETAYRNGWLSKSIGGTYTLTALGRDAMKA